jgi:hypothetical protein
MDWGAFAHGFGMLVTIVLAVLPFMALFIRNDEEADD